MATQVETAVYRLTVEGQDKVDGLAASVENLTASLDRSAPAARTSTQALQNRIAALDPAIKAQEQYRKSLEAQETTVLKGQGSLQQLDAHLALVTQRYADQTAAINAAAVAQENLRRQQANATTDHASAGNIIGAQQSNVDTRAYAAQFDQVVEIAHLKALQAGKNFQDTLNASFGNFSKTAAKSAEDSFAAFDEAGALPNANKGMVQLGSNTKAARYEMINLGRQAQDVVVSLGSGQGLMIVGLQQGSQILDVFLSSERKAADIIKGFGSTIGSFLINPMTIAVGTVTALVAVTLGLANAWDKVQVSSQRALNGAGARTGTTPEDINKFVARTSSSGNLIANTGLSDSNARKLGEGFTQSGDIVISKLHDMGAAVQGFANQTNISVDSAVDKFIEFGKDPVKAVAAFADAFGPLNNEQQKAVEAALILQDKTAALNVVIDANAEATKKASANMSVLDKTARVFSNTWDDLIGKARPGTGIDTQIENVKKQLNAAIENAPTNLGADDARLVAVSQNIKKLSDALVELQQKKEAANMGTLAAQMADVQAKARSATEAIIPQIAQLRELETRITALNAAQSNGVGGPDNSAALVAAKNQLAALKESQAEAARYNIEVQNIATSWGNVGQSVALQLQTMENALPVAKAWTEAGRMKAQYEATYLNNLNKGKTAQEATALASKEEELSKASAVASAQKMVQSSEDNLAKIQAQGTEMEGVVASSIAYRDAIQAGATQTQAAAIAANTLAANMLQAAKNADQMAQSATDAVAAGMKAAGGAASYYYGGNNSGGGSFADRSFSGTSQTITGLMSGTEQFYRAAAAISPSASDLISQATASGNTDAGISALKDAKVITGLQYGAGTVTFDSLGFPKGSQDDITTALMSLYDIKKNQSSDPGAVTKDEIATLQSLPQDQKTLDAIASLTESLNSVNGSTQALTQSNQDLLSPYYTQDPRTSHIGFRSQGMASGGEFTVPGGYSANDNMLGTIPLASGEIVSVRRPGESSGGVKNINITNHITIGAGANVDQFKRTIFQSTQNQARQLRAAS